MILATRIWFVTSECWLVRGVVVTANLRRLHWITEEIVPPVQLIRVFTQQRINCKVWLLWRIPKWCCNLVFAVAVTEAVRTNWSCLSKSPRNRILGRITVPTRSFEKLIFAVVSLVTIVQFCRQLFEEFLWSGWSEERLTCKPIKKSLLINFNTEPREDRHSSLH